MDFSQALLSVGEYQKSRGLRSEAINNLKLRASYGLLGNDRINPFQYLNSFTLRNGAYVIDGTPVPTFGVFQLANPDITWETAKKLDIGIELGFLQDSRWSWIILMKEGPIS